MLSLKQTVRNMKKLQLLAFTLLLAFPLFLPMGIASDVPFADVSFDVNNIPEPVPPPQEVRDFFELDPFYHQWISVAGFPNLSIGKGKSLRSKGSCIRHLADDRASSGYTKNDGIE